jgi:hypothetical protein
LQHFLLTLSFPASSNELIPSSHSLFLSSNILSYTSLRQASLCPYSRLNLLQCSLRPSSASCALVILSFRRLPNLYQHPLSGAVYGSPAATEN